MGEPERDGDGRVEAIWIKRAKGGPMDPRGQAVAVAGRGLLGNANQGGRRQVTIIAREAWEAAEEALGARLDPALRRANVMVSGLDLRHTRGLDLEIGAVRLRIRGETRPCRLMDDSWPGLEAALGPDWRGGVFAEVVGGGTLRVGDAARLTVPDDAGAPDASG